MSKEFKGTIEEWKVSKIDLADFKQICIYQNEKPKGKAICHLYFEGEITEEVEANARLIQKAPEMLEALQFFINNNMLSVIGEEVAERLINEIVG